MKRSNFYILIVVILLQSCNREFEVLEYHDNGLIKKECQMSSSKPDGLCKEYYPNGKLESIARYNQGALDGISEFFHINGTVHWRVDFDKGVKNGKVDYFDSLGRKYQTAYFDQNLLSDENLEYHTNGVVKTSAFYSEGKLHGDVSRFNEDEKLTRIERYDQDSLIQSKNFDENGKLVAKSIDYAISHEFKGSNRTILKVEIIEPLYDKHIFDVYDFKVKNDTLDILQERLYSDNSGFTYEFEWPDDRSELNLEGTLMELETLENNDDEVVVRSLKRVVYKIVRNSM
ncbi:toxin-antitoxin system YwqK family antitoxin [Roseivirga sp. E12]|uniref:toxin-antitoxin system YwqK family antitoxin n=1 Tax=Roseivirga sp. E12 TaxID=2819237 RepID=UPI001ABC20DA|nr:hypothetical protein [Roseivirga sp. E12]MBO3699522.1 hypothetical protein [Roseivirga sp. E12]